MPATQRGQARRLPSGRWQLRYYDADGERRNGGTFPSKTSALDHYRDRYRAAPTAKPEPRPKLTFAELG